jgi:hypothetical protein
MVVRGEVHGMHTEASAGEIASEQRPTGRRSRPGLGTLLASLLAIALRASWT